MSLSFTLSQTEIDRLLDDFKTVVESTADIQSILAKHMSIKSQPQYQPQPPAQSYGGLGTPPAPPDISQVKWRLPKKDGGGLASPSDGWCFAFIADDKGKIYPETKPIIDYITAHGSFMVNGYEVSISKSNPNFLNRGKAK